jgi:Ca2+/Na+ antiporter
MGLVVLAAGTSIPDALSSIVVAQDGHGGACMHICDYCAAQALQLPGLIDFGVQIWRVPMLLEVTFSTYS